MKAIPTSVFSLPEGAMCQDVGTLATVCRACKKGPSLISVIMGEHQARFEKMVTQLNALKQTTDELSKLAESMSKRAKRY